MAEHDTGQTQGQCKAKRRDGTRCRGRALRDRDVCQFHDPEKAALLQEGRREGGRAASHEARASKKLQHGESLILAEDRLLQVMADLIDGNIEPQAATAIAAVARSLVAIRTEARAGRAEERAVRAEERAKAEALEKRKRDFPDQAMRQLLYGPDSDTVVKEEFR